MITAAADGGKLYAVPLVKRYIPAITKWDHNAFPIRNQVHHQGFRERLLFINRGGKNIYSATRPAAAGLIFFFCYP